MGLYDIFSEIRSPPGRIAYYLANTHEIITPEIIRNKNIKWSTYLMELCIKYNYIFSEDDLYEIIDNNNIDKNDEYECSNFYKYVLSLTKSDDTKKLIVLKIYDILESSIEKPEDLCCCSGDISETYRFCGHNILEYIELYL